MLATLYLGCSAPLRIYPDISDPAITPDPRAGIEGTWLILGAQLTCVDDGADRLVLASDGTGVFLATEFDLAVAYDVELAAATNGHMARLTRLQDPTASGSPESLALAGSQLVLRTLDSAWVGSPILEVGGDVYAESRWAVRLPKRSVAADVLPAGETYCAETERWALQNSLEAAPFTRGRNELRGLSAENAPWPAGAEAYRSADAHLSHLIMLASTRPTQRTLHAVTQTPDGWLVLAQVSGAGICGSVDGTVRARREDDDTLLIREARWYLDDGDANANGNTAEYLIRSTETTFSNSTCPN